MYGICDALCSLFLINNSLKLHLDLYMEFISFDDLKVDRYDYNFPVLLLKAMLDFEV